MIGKANPLLALENIRSLVEMSSKKGEGARRAGTLAIDTLRELFTVYRLLPDNRPLKCASDSCAVMRDPSSPPQVHPRAAAEASGRHGEAPPAVVFRGGAQECLRSILAGFGGGVE
jgi:hypothetical protein